MQEAIEACLILLSIFGGASLIIKTSAQAKIAHLRAMRESSQAPQTAVAPQDEAVLAGLKALQQQIADVQNTSHQFDISFDAALTRLEERVSRVEAKAVGTPARAPGAEETSQRVAVR